MEIVGVVKVVLLLVVASEESDWPSMRFFSSTAVCLAGGTLESSLREEEVWNHH